MHSGPRGGLRYAFAATVLVDVLIGNVRDLRAGKLRGNLLPQVLFHLIESFAGPGRDFGDVNERKADRRLQRLANAIRRQGKDGGSAVREICFGKLANLNVLRAEAALFCQIGEARSGVDFLPRRLRSPLVGIGDLLQLALVRDNVLILLRLVLLPKLRIRNVDLAADILRRNPGEGHFAVFRRAESVSVRLNVSL